MRVKLAAATWTNLTSTLALVGQHVVVTADSADCSIGRKATAPTAGILLTEKEGVEVIVKQGDTLLLWAYSTLGCVLTVEQAGGKRVVLDGTGTT